MLTFKEIHDTFVCCLDDCQLAQTSQWHDFRRIKPLVSEQRSFVFRPRAVPISLLPSDYRVSNYQVHSQDTWLLPSSS